MSKHRARRDTAPVDSEGFRRVHRLTPLLKFWSLILALVTVFALNFNLQAAVDVFTFLQDGHLGEAIRGTAIALAAFVGVCALIWWVSGIWWRKLGFKLGEEDISIRSGVLSTRFRSARYDRTQAVDVVESLIARLFRLAALRIETAGGSGSAIEIAYLRKSEAEALRLEVLRHVRGAHLGAPADEEQQHPAEAEGNTVVPEIPVWRSLAGAATRTSTLTFVAFTALLFVLPGPNSSIIPIVIGFIPPIWGALDSSWRFNSRLTIDPQSGARVLDVAYGLTDRRRQNIRLSRIHAVRVAQPLLWRMFGWYEVQVSVAGYGAQGGGKQSGSTRILPVGTRQQAMELFALVSPLELEECERLACPEGPTQPTFTSPKRAFWASPLDRHKQAVTLHRDVAIMHAGLITRRVAAIETSHIQELTYEAGPISQLLNLATVRFELVAGPVQMRGEDLTPAHAAALLTRLRQRELPELQSPV